jgi:hypothetical protein
MPTKLRPIKDVIANPIPRGEGRKIARDRIEPKQPPQPPPQDKR